MLQVPALLWIVLGLFLILVEILTPTFVFVFFGTAALATGVAVALGLEHTYGLPFALFTALALAQIHFLRATFKSWFAGKEISVGPDNGDDDFIGHEVVALSGFDSHNRRGKVTFRGAHWAAVSNQPLAPGDVAFIRGRQGLTLVIDKLKHPAE